MKATGHSCHPWVGMTESEMGLIICTFHMETWRHREGLAGRRSHSKQSLGSKWGQMDSESRDQGFLKEVGRGLLAATRNVI